MRTPKSVIDKRYENKHKENVKLGTWFGGQALTENMQKK